MNKKFIAMLEERLSLDEEFARKFFDDRMQDLLEEFADDEEFLDALNVYYEKDYQKDVDEFVGQSKSDRKKVIDMRQYFRDAQDVNRI